VESDISATNAARRFSDLLNRVEYRGETFVVLRGNTPICRIAPVGPRTCTVSDLASWLKSAPKPDASYWDEIEQLTRNQTPPPDLRW
jgi:antitoxin (DNA-binding transcriptional repressor) of toxin-antitoxin stability system